MSTRRKFLKLLGLSTGAAITSVSGMPRFLNQEEIKQLTPRQQQFMIEYGRWMDAYLEVIRNQKDKPVDIENHKRMIELTEQAESMQPRLNEFMKDNLFSAVYKASIKRVSDEITT